MTWLRIFLVACGLGNLLAFALLWAIWDDPNIAVGINGFLLLLNAFLTHLNDEAHQIIRQQHAIIVMQQEFINGGPLP